MHHGASDQRGLVMAPRDRPLAILGYECSLAFPDPRPSFKPPRSVAAALRAFEAMLPTLLRKVFRASVVVGEVQSELLQRWRTVICPACRKQAHLADINEEGAHVSREH